ncbi:hypothetical protein C7N43_37875 [Sphingobacteriales bacterium UPWRP_1]|nr:hypothetical protein B6N25_16675 [Sphingobacteriales bacterium TSM_CSS]PSJ71720.1 hypothetical protein C7N43_37875 [Sphingobacteriales bacterium UPWRP_1]
MVLNDRYEYNPATDLLGKGGLAEVFKAYDKQTGRYVAIKKFTATDETLKYSLKNEFQKSLHLAHDNLVRAYDFFTVVRTFADGETHETQYGVMELIEGGDLNQYLQSNPPNEELLQMVKGILHGLHYLHTPNTSTDKGIIIHRDIKPGNILIYRNKQGQPIPKITDFNIAKEAATTTEHSQSMVGTYEYMAPEQLNPKKYGIDGKLQPNADLWALGVILYDYFNKDGASLFGKRAHGDSEGHIISNILDKPIPANAIKKLPAPFNGIIARCLVRPAQNRIESAQDLLNYLASLEETTLPVSPPPMPAPPAPIFKQPMLRNALLLACLLLLLLGLGYMVRKAIIDVPPTTKQTDYLALARNRFEEKNWQLAIVNADSVLATTPNQPEALLLKQQATDSLNQAIPVPTPPPGEDAYNKLIDEGNNLFVRENYAQAKAKYEAALILKPDDKVAAGNIKKCTDALNTAKNGTKTPSPLKEEPQTKQEQPNPNSSSSQGGTKPSSLPSQGGANSSSGDISGKDIFASQMVFVQGGTFTMGCTPERDGDCEDDEKPAHKVTVSNFYISKYEVTQAQWQAIMGSNPSKFKGCPQCPVESVSWDDIQEFLQKLNAQTGKNYRLPTEAEWEYAARGGNKTNGYKYAGSNDIDRVAWYEDNSSDRTHSVGQKSLNELGLYDMSGNVWEWCSDWYDYDKEYYTNSPDRNPKGPASGTYRVLRGGCWYINPRYCRTAYRSSNTPGYRHYYCGFRVLVSP